MDIFHTIILGIIEGITEFLPVSSTGHLAILAEWLGVQNDNFLSSFNIAIQLGAILAAVALYAKRIFTNTKLWSRLAIAFIPTVLAGVTLYKFIKPLIDNAWVAVCAIFLGGIIMIIVEKYLQKYQPAQVVDSDEVPTLKQSFYIGLYQVIAFIPGVSRSAATIIGGMIHGVSRYASVEFSFLLAIPTMIAATGYDLFKSGAVFSLDNWVTLLIGGTIAFITAFFVMKWLLKYVQKYSLIPFGVYRIVFAIIFVLIYLK